MSKTMNKTLMTIEIINIVAFLNNAIETKKIDELGVKFRWAIKKSMKELVEVDNKFRELKEELESGLKEEFFMNDEKSELTTITQKGEDGQDVPIEVKKVKDNYMDEYNRRLDEINSKLREVLYDTNDVTISVVDVDSEIEKLSDDTAFTFEDLEMLSVFDREDA